MLEHFHKADVVAGPIYDVSQIFEDPQVQFRATLANPKGEIVNGLFLRNIILERYLHIVDQAGVSGTINLMGNNYLEGNFGYLKSSGYGDRFGGTLRLVMPINSKVAFTVEGGVNETLLGRGNNSRAVVELPGGTVIATVEGHTAAPGAIPAAAPSSGRWRASVV